MIIKSMYNLEGTICTEKERIVYFKFHRGSLEKVKVYCTDKKIIPFDFWRGFDEETVISFFEHRVTPPTRQGLKESLREIGMEYYDSIQLIQYNCGLCIHDWYYFEEGEEIPDGQRLHTLAEISERVAQKRKVRIAAVQEKLKAEREARS